MFTCVKGNYISDQFCFWRCTYSYNAGLISSRLRDMEHIRNVIFARLWSDITFSCGIILWYIIYIISYWWWLLPVISNAKLMACESINKWACLYHTCAQWLMTNIVDCRAGRQSRSVCKMIFIIKEHVFFSLGWVQYHHQVSGLGILSSLGSFRYC